ncbi:MAG TPA: hypothetical protein VM120_29670 [Bryobacteraceae bacterium]|nr:hypothetical protein [Bryobacteraceae bacterium]
MLMKMRSVALWVAIPFLCSAESGVVKKAHRSGVATAEVADRTPSVLWRDPGNLASRDLFFGPGGEKHQPPAAEFTFLKEDSKGSNPKFVVQDVNGVKWKVKLGAEARPETVSTRFVWAVGYFADEDYFVPRLRIRNMPHLRRGGNVVKSDGAVHNARLERDSKSVQKVGNWRWKKDAFYGTREHNGLRVMMALINNWDLKDVNTAVYRDQDDPAALHYAVSDLGVSFGTAGPDWPVGRSRGNLREYRNSRFISRVTPDTVSFAPPAWPACIFLFHPPQYIHRIGLRWIGRKVPRSDVRWIAQMLAGLSPQQIRDAFRAGGYEAKEIEDFTKVMQGRIAELARL